MRTQISISMILVAMLQAPLVIAAPPEIGTLEIPGITDKPVPIYSAQFSGTQSETLHIGDGGGAGKVNVGDFIITKMADDSSPMFFKYLAMGERIAEVNIVLNNAVVTKRGTKETIPIYYTFNKSIIVSVGIKSDQYGEVFEDLTINFAELEMKTTNSSFCWDIQENTTCR